VNSDLVTVDPEIMSGEPVFAGTRVPVRNLIDYLSGGHSLDDFLEGFPGVTREQAVSFLQEASSALLHNLTPRKQAA
jgi:uncharacterized protein (DUF433 family)